MSANSLISAGVSLAESIIKGIFDAKARKAASELITKLVKEIGKQVKLNIVQKDMIVELVEGQNKLTEENKTLKKKLQVQDVLILDLKEKLRKKKKSGAKK
jgi:hypothetical protein